jgi:Tol biopolymer transport system component
VIVGGEFGNAWRYDIANGAGIQLTHGDRAGSLAWAPDGAHLIVSMRQGGSNDLYRITHDGTGDPERLVNLPGLLAGTLKQPVGWTDQGRTLVFFQYGMKQQPPFWTVTLKGSPAPRAISLNGTQDWGGSVSPDGHWLAYTAQRSNRSELFVSALPTGRPSWQVTSSGGRLPRWAQSGREIFYWQGRRLMVIPVTTSDGTFVPGEPRSLFEGDYFEMQYGEPNYDVAPDDERLLFVQRGGTNGPERLNVVQGWRSEIERRLGEAR